MATTRSKRGRKALHRQSTHRRKCSIMIPGVGVGMLPTRCEGRHYRHGQCVEHFTDSKNAKEARAIEAREFRAKQIAKGELTPRGRVALPSSPALPCRITTWIPKAERKHSRAVAS